MLPAAATEAPGGALPISFFALGAAALVVLLAAGARRV